VGVGAPAEMTIRTVLPSAAALLEAALVEAG
jgi:hypothetical protein